MDAKKRQTGMITVTKTVGKKPESKEEMIDVQPFAVEPAHVYYAQGATVNLGNYNSGKIDVSISLPCYKEEVDLTFVLAKAWVVERFEAECKDLIAGKR